MTVRDDMIAALNGEVPERTPFIIGNWYFVHSGLVFDEWRDLFDQGLAFITGCGTIRLEEHGVHKSVERRVEGDELYRITRKETPVGTIQRVTLDSVSKPRAIEWMIEHYIKEPKDYKVRQWIVEHTEPVPQYDAYEKLAAMETDYSLTIVGGGRTPAMSIMVDYAGMEKFSIDVATEAEELFDLYEAQKRLFLECNRLIAKGPGRFFIWGENLTAPMLGPKRYRDLLLPIYKEAVPVLEAGGKRVGVHYDGQLRSIADEVAESPFHMLQSLTEPPEGDMMLDECRAAWPDKTLWVNVNLDLYNLPEPEFRDAIIAMRERAGKKGLALGISEDVPDNWATTVPLILETLQELG